MDECQFLHIDIAHLGELHRDRRLPDQPAVRQILARTHDSLDSEVPLEVGFDFGCRSRLADFLQVLQQRLEQCPRCAPPCTRRWPPARSPLPCASSSRSAFGVDRGEELGIQRHRLRNHFAIGNQPRAQSLRSAPAASPHTESTARCNPNRRASPAICAPYRWLGSAHAAAPNNCNCVSRSPIPLQPAHSPSIVASCVYSSRPFARNECMNELRRIPPPSCETPRAGP